MLVRVSVTFLTECFQEWPIIQFTYSAEHSQWLRFPAVLKAAPTLPSMLICELSALSVMSSLLIRELSAQSAMSCYHVCNWSALIYHDKSSRCGCLYPGVPGLNLGVRSTHFVWPSSWCRLVPPGKFCTFYYATEFCMSFSRNLLRKDGCLTRYDWE
jgi:hypothetical protein